MTFFTVRIYHIRLIFYCFCKKFKMNNMNSTVQDSQLLLSLQPFLLQCVWQHDVTRHIYNVFFLEFLFLSYCTLHSLNTGYKIKCDVNWVIIEFSTNPSIRQSTINERKMFLDSRPRGEVTKKLFMGNWQVLVPILSSFGSKLKRLNHVLVPTLSSKTRGWNGSI